MKTIYTLFFALCATITTFAQSGTGAISGKLLEENGSPASFVTLMLLDKDSILVKADFSKDDGSFLFLNITPGTYNVQVSSIQYREYVSETFILEEGETIKLPEISLSTAIKKLDEVQISASRPMIEIQPDKTVFNVSSSPNASGSDGMELLRKSPGVIIDNNDNIILQGKSGVRIYIDGKPSQLSGEDLTAMLRGMQSDQIESIELITNPSAKYEAEGNAGIINIVLKRDKNLGTNATFTAGYNIGVKERKNGSVNINHKEKKVSLYGSFNYSDLAGWNHQEIDREQGEGFFHQKGDRVWTYDGFGYRGGTDFYINKKHTIGVVINGNMSDGTWDSDSRTQMGDLTSGTINTILEANNERARSTNSANANLNYQYKGSKGASLNVDFDYGYYFNTAYMYQPNEYLSPSSDELIFGEYFENNQTTQIDIKTAKLDYEVPLEKGKISAGAKYSNIITGNSFDQFDLNGAIPTIDINRTSDFTYTEQVTAVYATYFTKLGEKTSLNAGVRMESTLSKGDLDSYLPINDGLVERSYTDLFPSGGITYNMNKDNQFGVNYSRRIDRPNYQDLNPFEFQLDQLTYEKGNPFIRPQYTHNIQATHTFKSTINTKLSYSVTNDFFAKVIEKVNDSTTLLQNQNLATSKNYGLNISAPYNITKWWSTYTSVNLNKVFYESELSLNNQLNINVTTFNVYIQNNFMLPKGFKFELSGWYNSPSVWGGTFIIDELYSINMGIKKSLFDKKANLTVGLNDILFSQKWSGSSNYNNVDLNIRGMGDSRRFKVGFTYNIGNQNVKSRRRKTGLEDEKNRISSDNG
ncbi:MAG: TonB-dependent receptor [Cyclobacteriaceae bacterium]|nr:TonB-dependent receptor [Cyclobacteriaceae bacterium]